MKISDLPKHLRPREKLVEKGAQSLQTKELLAILIRTGRSGQSAIDIAQALLKKYPLEQFKEIQLSDLKQVSGLDIGKASTIIASIEISKRIFNTYKNTLPLITKPEDALTHLHSIRSLKREYFVVQYLNARNQLIRQDTISIGTINASLVHPREVFAPALELRASNILLAHNHPSGDVTPSSEDLDITEKLVDAGQILAIDVVDHLIVSSTNYLSMKQEGLVL